MSRGLAQGASSDCLQSNFDGIGLRVLVKLDIRADHSRRLSARPMSFVIALAENAPAFLVRKLIIWFCQ